MAVEQYPVQEDTEERHPVVAAAVLHPVWETAYLVQEELVVVLEHPVSGLDSGHETG